MTRTFVPGNRRDGGFILLDALLCLALVSLLALAAGDLMRPVQALGQGAASRTAELLEKRNQEWRSFYDSQDE